MTERRYYHENDIVHEPGRFILKPSHAMPVRNILKGMGLPENIIYVEKAKSLVEAKSPAEVQKDVTYEEFLDLGLEEIEAMIKHSSESARVALDFLAQELRTRVTTEGILDEMIPVRMEIGGHPAAQELIKLYLKNQIRVTQMSGMLNHILSEFKPELAEYSHSQVPFVTENKRGRGRLRKPIAEDEQTYGGRFQIVVNQLTHALNQAKKFLELDLLAIARKNGVDT